MPRRILRIGGRPDNTTELMVNAGEMVIDARFLDLRGLFNQNFRHHCYRQSVFRMSVTLLKINRKIGEAIFPATQRGRFTR
jgi:hypothetical protein